MAELSLTTYCWLLSAPRIRPQRLGKIIPWSKEDRWGEEKARALEKDASQVPQVDELLPGECSTHSGIS